MNNANTNQKMPLCFEEMYKKCLSNNIKRSQKHHIEQGRFPFLAPLGYLNTRDNNNKATIIVDEGQATIVKRLFEEYVNGKYSIKKLTVLAQSLDLHSKNSKNKTISQTCVNNMLKNPFYYGVMRINGNFMPHIYTPIIDKELFDIVQTVLIQKKH